jgi:hypothetical protein
LVRDIKEEHRLKVFESRVLKGVFGTSRGELAGGWGVLIKRSFIICTLLKVV